MKYFCTLFQRQIIGCYFHWSQCVYRRIQSEGLGEDYIHNRTTRRILQEVIQLPYLPSSDIRTTFLDIKDDLENTEEPCQKDDIRDVLEYVESQWISGRQWGPAKWSVFRLSVRTNNDTEGWHNGLNIIGPAPSLYRLVELLHTKAHDADLEGRMVAAGKSVRRERLQSRTEQDELQRLWDLYEQGRLSPRMLLREIVKMKNSR